MGLGEKLLALLFPSRCMFCRRVIDEGHVCPDCRGTLPFVTGIRRGDAHYACSVSSLRYMGAVREAAVAMKFHGKQSYARGFGALLADSVRTELAGRYDVVTWVPVSSRRLRERGYDQSRIIAETAAKLLGAEARVMLRKTRQNETQSGISDEARRRENVRDVYEAVDPEEIAGRRVLLVDDILTTGATMSECAKVLRAAGAREVLAAAAMLAGH